MERDQQRLPLLKAVRGRRRFQSAPEQSSSLVCFLQNDLHLNESQQNTLFGALGLSSYQVV